MGCVIRRGQFKLSSVRMATEKLLGLSLNSSAPVISWHKQDSWADSNVKTAPQFGAKRLECAGCYGNADESLSALNVDSGQVHVLLGFK